LKNNFAINYDSKIGGLQKATGDFGQGERVTFVTMNG